MAYTPYEWADGEEGGTPITAERLNHVEQGVESAATTADSAAPATHNHAAADTTSGTFTVARIPDLGISKVTGLQAAIDGKAATSHTHTIANVTGLEARLAALEAAIEALETPVE